MGIIANIEQASGSRLAVYTAISSSITILCAIVARIYDPTPDKFIMIYVSIAGIIWSVMFGIGAFLKLIK